MNVLLRSYNDKHYVWKPATWINGTYFLFENDVRGSEIRQSNIIDVADDIRGGYVKCKNCGKLILNTPEAIEQHFEETEAKKDCLKCSHVTPSGSKFNIQTKYEPIGDGVYAVKSTFNTRLVCNVGWYTNDIHNKDAKANCIYAKCRRYGVQAIDDIFVKYPNLFNKHITVDVLKKYKYVCEGYLDGYYEYDLKCRGTIKACVNELGIVDHFSVHTRGCEYNVYYSAQYGKAFFIDWNKYDENWQNYIGEAKYNQFIAKLLKLYSEENANEEE